MYLTPILGLLLYSCSCLNKICFTLYFRMPHNTLCEHLFALQILHKLLFSNALGNIECLQEHLKTTLPAKFGGKESVLWSFGK